MKKIIITISVVVLFVSSLSSQNKIFIGDKSYPCSETFTFTYPDFFGKQDLDIMFIKDKDVGMIALTIKAHWKEDRIKGKILIYLDNETVITCLDRNKYDYVNGMATTIYYLTKEEINKMKNSNITAIRFSTDTENFEASNLITEEGWIQQGGRLIPQKKYKETNVSDIVNEFFNN